MNVYKYKYIAVIVSGAMSGLAGAFLVVGLNFQNRQTAGRGYIGLASLIFGNWRPGGMAAGATVVRLHRRRAAVRRRPAEPCTPSCCWSRSPCCIYAALQFRARNTTIAVVTVVIAALALIWFFSTDVLPPQLVKAAPYTITLLVHGAGVATAAAAQGRRHALPEGLDR